MTDSYVIQIYRRDPADPDQMTGVVERIGNGDGRAFHSMHELWAFLRAAHSASPRPDAKRGSDATQD